MNIFKKLKLLKILFNGTHVFYRAGKSYYFETRITNKEDADLIREYVTYVKK